MNGALRGVRVLEFATLLSGPMAGLWLAEAGADVIKIENPARGDDMRHYHPRRGNDSVSFNLLNRGKQSVALDLESADGRARALALMASADVVVEQFRPGVTARLGLSNDDARACKPDIIYCSITGYGQTGPRATRAEHDLNYQAEAGLLPLSCGTPESPVVPPALIAYIAGGSYPAIVNILLALRDRDRRGQGAYLDIAMADNLFPFTYWAQGRGEASATWPGNGDALVTGGSPRYRLYTTADAGFIAVAALEDRFSHFFCKAIGLAATLRDDSLTRAATTEAITAIIGRATADEWSRVLADVDCCSSIVRSLREARADPQFVARGVFQDQGIADDSTTLTALPRPINHAFRRRSRDRDRAPTLGEHADAILGHGLDRNHTPR